MHENELVVFNKAISILNKMKSCGNIAQSPQKTNFAIKMCSSYKETSVAAFPQP